MHIAETIAQLKGQIKNLRGQLRKLEREERHRQPRELSEQEIKNQAEQNRRAAAGENVEPLVEFVDLEKLVGSDVYESVIEYDRASEIHTFNLRGSEINFFTPNLRALWQSSGQEYIEPELLDFIDTLPENAIYFDVGASTGVFAIYAAMKGNRTICFEPEVANFQILNMNSFVNHQSIKNNFAAYNVALSDITSVDNMFIRKFGGAAHEKILGDDKVRNGTERFDAEYVQSVVSVTMDQFCSMAQLSPTDIKIDVDGAETRLVAGMVETLNKPTLKRIFIEISETQENSMRALETILSYGFQISKKNRVQNYHGDFNYTLQRY